MTSRRNEARVLAGILSLGLLARLGAVLYLGVPDIIETTEAGRIAAQWVQGRGYAFDFYGYRVDQPLTSFVPPLYTALIAVCLYVSSRPDLILGIAQAVLSTLTIAATYSIGRRAIGRPLGLITAGLVAAYPVYIIEAARPLSLSLNAFLLATLVALTLALPAIAKSPGPLDMPRSLVYGGAIGAVVGISALSRSSMLGLLPGVLLWMVLNRDSVPNWRMVSLVTCVAAASVLAPWAVRNWRRHGRLLLSTNAGITLWNGNNPFTTGSAWDVYVDRARAYTGSSYPDYPASGIVVLKPYPLPHEVAPRVDQLTEVALDRALFAAGLAFIRQNPRQWLSLLGQKFVSFWWFRPNIGESINLYRQSWILPYQLAYATMLPLAVLGAYLCRQDWRRHLLIWYAFTYFTAIYVIFNVVTRYRWEFETLILMYFGLSLHYLLRPTVR